MSIWSKIFKTTVPENPDSTLSKRGFKASKSILRIDMDIYFEATKNLFDKETNPNGAFPLNVAENKLSWDILREKIREVTLKNEIPAWVAGYTSGMGAPSFREVVAQFFSKFLTKCPINPDHLVFSAGATSIIEMTAMVLGDEGDVVAFPAPCYPVYKQDIGNTANLERYDIVTHHDISALNNGPILKTIHLDTAKKEIENAGKKFKILVLSNPDNPTGGIYSYDHLIEITNWCLENKIHLIVSEIYGLSLINTKHSHIKEDYSTPIEFVSFAQIMSQKQSDYLHLWYSFSKDFGISGFRVGCVYSLNQLFLKAYENLNYPRLISNYTKWVMELILQDEQFIQSYISINQQRLTEAYVVVRNTMKRLDIDYVPSRGSLFIWADFSRFLDGNTQNAENDFWMEIYKKTNILLTPGEGFGHSKKGHFRIVHSYFKKEDLEIAMARLEEYILTKNN